MQRLKDEEEARKKAKKAAKEAERQRAKEARLAGTKENDGWEKTKVRSFLI